MIKVENISYHIGKKEILNNVSFTAHEGQVLAIMGTNGAGKSTLLRNLSGELKPVSGSISMASKKLADWKPEELALRKAVLQQQTNLTLPFLVQEVVLMGRYPHFKGKATQRDMDIVEASLKKTGMDHLAAQSYTELSGGEQQRVHLARVFAQIEKEFTGEPNYLLLDEPVNSLDIRFQHHTLDMAKAYARAGNCVVVVLHDLNLAAYYADRILLMKKGRIAGIGSPAEVMTGELISEAFGFPASVEKHPYLDCPVVYFGHEMYRQIPVEAAGL